MTEILTVTNRSLFFGCVKAVDSSGADATILWNERGKRMRTIPTIGDEFICMYCYCSVYVPFGKVNRGHIELRKLPIANDILYAHFPIIEVV